MFAELASLYKYNGRHDEGMDLLYRLSQKPQDLPRSARGAAMGAWARVWQEGGREGAREGGWMVGREGWHVPGIRVLCDGVCYGQQAGPRQFKRGDLPPGGSCALALGAKGARRPRHAVRQHTA